MPKHNYQYKLQNLCKFWERRSIIVCHTSTGIPPFIVKLLQNKEPSLLKVYGLQILRESFFCQEIFLFTLQFFLKKLKHISVIW